MCAAWLVFGEPKCQPPCACLLEPPVYLLPFATFFLEDECCWFGAAYVHDWDVHAFLCICMMLQAEFMLVIAHDSAVVGVFTGNYLYVGGTVIKNRTGQMQCCCWTSGMVQAGT